VRRLSIIPHLADAAQYEKRWRNRSWTYESVKRQAIVAVENMLLVLHGQTPHAQANIL
jgi:hypothetical protein